jgi:enoyl-CoA hydratase/carnithine racemase
MAKIEIEIKGPVRRVTLNRPEKRNALDAEMLDELTEAFRSETAAEDRVTVLRATGTVFCSGLDLRGRKAIHHGESSIEDLLRAMGNYSLPVVAVVQGDAIAGGNELALHCDIVVAASGARFGMPQAQIGLAPTWFLAKKLAEILGPVMTRKMLMLGEPVAASRLYELGAIAEIAAPEELEVKAATIIERLAANSPLALRAIKAIVVREMQFRDNIPHADIDAIVTQVGESADAKEGMAARLEKRLPVFQGK